MSSVWQEAGKNCGVQRGGDHSPPRRSSLDRRIGITVNGRLVHAADQLLALGHQGQALVRRTRGLADHRQVLIIQIALQRRRAVPVCPGTADLGIPGRRVNAFQLRLQVTILRQACTGRDQAPDDDVLFQGRSASPSYRGRPLRSGRAWSSGTRPPTGTSPSPGSPR